MKIVPSILAILIAILSSCQSSVDKSKILSINLVQEPTSLDPLACRNLTSLFLARHFHEGLFRYEEEIVQKALAEKVEVSADGLVYRIFLKKAYFDEGSKITAHDFVSSMNRILQGQVKSDYAHLVYVIKNAQKQHSGVLGLQLGIKALSDECVEYTLEYPYPDFTALLTHPIFFPVKYTGDKLCFCGPFKPGLHQVNHKFELIKNESYYDKDRVYLKKITGLFLGADTALALFKNQELDFLGSPLGLIPQDALKGLDRQNQLSKKQMLGIAFLRINTTKFSEPRFRNFLRQSLNKELLVKQALMGYHTPCDQIVPALFNFKLKGFPIDNGFCQNYESIKLAYTAQDQRLQNLACMIKSQVESCGVKIELKPQESKMLLQDLAAFNYDLMLGSWIADVKDPENFLSLFSEKSCLINGTGWENSSYKALLEQAKYSPSDRFKLLAQAQELLLQECPIIPLFQYNMLYAASSKLTGYSLNSLGILDFKQARVD